MIKVTTKMSGKMSHMISINTSSLSNDYCQNMAKTDSVCSKCYSNSALKRYKNADKCFTNNGDILSSSILPIADLPRLNAMAVRFNAYGELINMNHLINLMNICNINHRTTFTLWTKRAGLVWKYLRDFPKPSNLILVYSSAKINEMVPILPEHFDKVFTVYSKDYAKNVDINCGSKKCFDCMTCYDVNNKTVEIKEIVK